MVKKTELNEMLQMVIDDYESIGLMTGCIRPEITINNRTKTTLGRCFRKRQANTYLYNIELSGKILQSEELTIDTLYHEVLHTVEGCFNHGEKFKHYARIIKKELNVTIERTADPKEYGLQGREKDAKYILTCSCGQQYYYYRKSKVIKNYQNCICPKCNKSELTLTQNY